jgi:hypothetical protein
MALLIISVHAHRYLPRFPDIACCEIFSEREIFVN